MLNPEGGKPLEQYPRGTVVLLHLKSLNLSQRPFLNTCPSSTKNYVPCSRNNQANLYRLRCTKGPNYAVIDDFTQTSEMQQSVKYSLICGEVLTQSMFGIFFQLLLFYQPAFLNLHFFNIEFLEENTFSSSSLFIQLFF